jgi:Flp pilus assembly protein TadD
MDDQPDLSASREQQADRERRIAWRTASVLTLLNSLLNAIVVTVSPEKSPVIATLISATVVDVFLAVNLWRDKKWARDWMIVRLIIGVILWSIINYASGGWPNVVGTMLLCGSLLLVLVGRPRNWRTVIGAALYSLTFLSLLGLVLLGALGAKLSGMSPASLNKMQEAGTALQEEDYMTAIRLYAEVTRTEPDNVAARYGLCQAYMVSDNPSLAINSCDKAVELAPQSGEIRAYQAYVLLTMQRHDAALASAETALNLDATSYLAYFVRAIIRADAGDLTAARADFARAIQHAPNDAERANIQGVADQMLGQEGAALQRRIEMTDRHAEGGRAGV